MDETINNDHLEYTGKIKPDVGERDKNGQLLFPYLPDKALVDAVNLAIHLERPLLIKGEPGCGKTRLARAVAYELDLPFEAWYVKSTSRARDGLYTYDTVARLRDAQLVSTDLVDRKELGRINDPMTYVEWGPLGKAFQQDTRTVVLVDEIDKADIDFPNDLLLELDEKRFFVEETIPRKEILAQYPPIVFITSNDEKDLPDAFLRRCLFHYLEFPKRDRLTEIVKAHLPMMTPDADDLIDVAIERFLDLRKELRETRRGAGKNVSTSELIDWLQAINRLAEYYPKDEVLQRVQKELLYPGILLKSWDDYRRYLPQAGIEE